MFLLALYLECFVIPGFGIYDVLERGDALLIGSGHLKLFGTGLPISDLKPKDTAENTDP
jgi:hypothetical protein